MDRYPKDELQLKILFGIKALPILKKNWKTYSGGEGGGWMPLPIGGSNKPMTDQALLNSLASAAMIHTLSGTTSVSGSVQYPLRMNLILSNF